VKVVDEFAIRKNGEGSSVQVDDTAPGDPAPPSLSVEGTREDSGRVHTTGEVTHVTLEVTAATEHVEIRDRDPALTWRGTMLPLTLGATG
jgi:hypothetical protein